MELAAVLHGTLLQPTVYRMSHKNVEREVLEQEAL